MKIWVLSLFVLWAAVPVAEADVYFEEELVNPGFGSKKTGARKTINKVYIKDKRQRVEVQIVVDKKTEKVLKKQGQPLRSSTILNLNKAEVYEIDLDAQTFVRGKVQPARPAAPKSVAKKAAKVAAPRIGFSYKVPGDSSVVAGIVCKRVVAQMRARHYKKKKLHRENRYTYDACIAKKFPGLNELLAFQALQDTSTSYPSLVGGGLEQFSSKAEDLGQLKKKLEGLAEELDGFALKSTLTASVMRRGKKKPKEIFRLERKVKKLRYRALPDSLFSVSKALTQVKK
ncbi:MAG: hypothetical protein ACI906_001404 [Candidatus Latescibacterota bacterium]|jgi:hypothetical protein